MKTDLAVNPFLEIQFLNEQEASYLLVAPKPRSGLQQLKISKSDNPNLHELFWDLAKIRFDLLDVEKDMGDAERELLFESGVLVEAGNAPRRPLFACRLDEVEILEFTGDASDLIVNPTARFAPVDLGNFNSWIQEKALSPYQPTVWVKTPAAKIETGYWLEPEQAEIVSRLSPGKGLSFKIEETLLIKLIAAEILIFPEKHLEKEEACRQKLQEAASHFGENKYAVLRALLPGSQIKAMRNYYREYIGQGFMPFGDPQVDRRYYQHNEPLARFFHSNLANLMSSIAGEEVKPSYVYAASYKEGATLKPHVDREACEFSFSFQVDYHPESESGQSPWALYLSTKKLPHGNLPAFEWEDFPEHLNSEETKAVYLACGDSLVYKGCELVHYRYALPAGHRSTSLFFHYVPRDFEGNLT